MNWDCSAARVGNLVHLTFCKEVNHKDLGAHERQGQDTWLQSGGNNAGCNKWLDIDCAPVTDSTFTAEHSWECCGRWAENVGKQWMTHDCCAVLCVNLRRLMVVGLLGGGYSRACPDSIQIPPSGRQIKIPSWAEVRTDRNEAWASSEGLLSSLRGLCNKNSA